MTHKLLLRHVITAEGEKVPILCFEDGTQLPNCYAVTYKKDVLDNKPASITLSMHMGRDIINELEKQALPHGG